MLVEFAWIVAGALVGGFVNGMTGFGTALGAMPFWLQSLPAPLAAQLAAAGGVIGQIQTLPQIRHAIHWQQIRIYVISGLAGVPVGLLFVPYISLEVFKSSVGIVLVVYASLLLAASPVMRVPRSPTIMPALIGFGGGVLGGIAGLSGVLPTIWASLTGMPKDERRALFQSYNLVILSAVLAGSLIAGLVTARFLIAVLVAIPATIAGARLGLAVYRRLNDRRFDRVVLVLLLLSGLSLLLRG